ncbi:hypothetical protein [Nocardioides sp.]|uniref:hypothetical protein n=1 Tax=Nocardioides sp. TaxID=35761 RepID=UPI003513AB05
MPSAAVWQILTEGGVGGEGPKRGHQALMSVVLGMKQAGWAEVHIRRALRENNSATHTPGHWLCRQTDPDRELGRALAKATARVAQTPANPSLSLPTDPHNAQRAKAHLDAVDAALLDPQFSRRHPGLLPPDVSITMLTCLAGLLQKAHQHAQSQIFDEADSTVSVAASARCLAVMLNLEHQTVSRALRAISTPVGSDNFNPRALVQRFEQRRNIDAVTYLIDVGRFQSTSTSAVATSPSLPQVSPQRYMAPTIRPTFSEAVVSIACHDAFTHSPQPRTPEDPVATRTQGFLLALIAASPTSPSAKDLSFLSGLKNDSIRKALAPLLTPSPLLADPPLTSAQGAYRLTGSPSALDSWLTGLANARGTTGTRASRQRKADDQRAAWADHQARTNGLAMR